MTSLMLSMLFGMIGMGFFMFGKKTLQVIPMVAGAALMVCPYFISNVVILLIVCAAIMAFPFVCARRG